MLLSDALIEGRIFAKRDNRISGIQPPNHSAVVAGGMRRQRSHYRSSAKGCSSAPTRRGADRAGVRMAGAVSGHFRTAHRTVDHAAAGRADRTVIKSANKTAIPQRLAQTPRCHAADVRQTGRLTRQGGHLGLTAAPVADHQRKARRLKVTRIFTTRTGFLPVSLVRRSLAPIRHTPILHPSMRYRNKMFLATALAFSSVQGHLGLYYQAYPDQYMSGDLYTHLPQNLLWHIRRPMMLLHDAGLMRHGVVVPEVQAGLPRLHLHRFPPYAPELNPPEQARNYPKYHRLGNFIFLSVEQTDRAVCEGLKGMRHGQNWLRSFLSGTPLNRKIYCLPIFKIGQDFFSSQSIKRFA